MPSSPPPIMVCVWRRALVGVAALIVFCAAGAGHAKMRVFENAPTTSFPARLQSHLAEHPIHQGFLDVTKPPYSAANDDATDAAPAIQQAIDDAYASNLVVFFPPGTYLCRAGLRCFQGRIESSHAESQRKFAHKLVGSTKGPARPVLKLADGAALEDGAFLRFAYINEKGGEEAPRHYCATFRGIDIDMGANPAATALRMNGAQYCEIADTRIFGASFNVGLDGLPGSGGSAINVRVDGGKIGLRQDSFRPNPSVAGLELLGQSQCGIQIGMIRGPLVVAGFRIVGPPASGAAATGGYEAVHCGVPQADGSVASAVGNLVLVDGTIDLNGAGTTAIRRRDNDVYLENVFVKAATVMESDARDSAASRLAGHAPGWTRVERCAVAAGADKSHLFVDGAQLGRKPADAMAALSAASGPPPDDLVSRHLPPRPVPSWEDADVLDVTAAEFGATADDPSDDDAPRIQAALDAAANPASPHHGKTVFLPRGHFHVRSPIMVPRGGRLLGAAETISVLHVDPQWVLSASASVLTTADDPEAEVVLARFAILGQTPSPSAATETQRDLSYLTIQSGRTTIVQVQFSQVESWKKDYQLSQPTARFRGGAGGRVYNLCEDNIPSGNFAPGFPRASYHILSIEGTRQPLAFYQTSVEHLNSGPAQASLSDAANVAFYGLKYESQHRLLDATRCSNLRILGGSGNYGLVEPTDTSILQLEDCRNVRIAGLVRKPPANEASDKAWLIHGADVLDDDAPLAFYGHTLEPPKDAR